VVRVPWSASTIREGFQDPADHPCLAGLTPLWSEIAEEARAALGRLDFLRYRFPQIYDSDRPGVEGRRAMFYLYVLGARVERNCALAPKTAAALESFPGLATAAFYVLGPQTRILPHCGVPQDRMLRAHLGLVCPPECYLRIANEKQSWSDGNWMVFDDRLEHEAWNASDETRCVLSLDFMPFPSEGDGAMLKQLRMAMLQAKPTEAPWYLAAGLEIDPELRPEMDERWEALLPRRRRGLESLIETNGLFFT